MRHCTVVLGQLHMYACHVTAQILSHIAAWHGQHTPIHSHEAVQRATPCPFCSTHSMSIKKPINIRCIHWQHDDSSNSPTYLMLSMVGMHQSTHKMQLNMQHHANAATPTPCPSKPHPHQLHALAIRACTGHPQSQLLKLPASPATPQTHMMLPHAWLFPWSE